MRRPSSRRTQRLLFSQLTQLTLLALLLLSLSAVGCRLLDELAHTTAPRIVAHRPTGEVVASFSAIEIDFSAAMARSTTEMAFSLEMDGQEIDGRFRWRNGDRRLLFVPEQTARPGDRLHVHLHTTAEDRWGNSLARDYEFSFFVNSAGPSPRLDRHAPADNEDGVELGRSLELRFSQPIDPVSLYGLLAIEPALRGSFVWEQGYRLVRFELQESYRPDTLYRITLDGILRARSGVVALIDEQFAFVTALPPMSEILSVVVENRLHDSLDDSTPIRLRSTDEVALNESGVERMIAVRANFSLPIAIERRARLFRIVPAIPFDLTWAADGSELVAALLEPLQWQQTYQISLLDRHYRFVVDGHHSRPPTLTEALYIADSDNPQETQLLQESANVSFMEGDRAELLFHFELADGAALDLGSFGESLRVESDSAVFDFTTRDIAVGVSSDGRPFARALLRIGRNGSPPDIVTISLDRDLRDSLGNRIAEPIQIAVNGL